MPDDLESLIPGFQYAESRGEAHPFQAVGDAGRSRGAFQIQPIMYQDIQRVYPEAWGQVAYEDMLAAPETQRAAMLAGLQMLRDHYGLSGDALISAWNTGPGAARKGHLNQAYIDTVKLGMKGNAAMNRMKGR